MSDTAAVILAYVIIIVVVVVVVLVPFLAYGYAKHKPKVTNLTPPNGTNGVQQIMITFRGTQAKLAEALSPYTSDGWMVIQTDSGSSREAIFTSRKWTVVLTKSVDSANPGASQYGQGMYKGYQTLPQQYAPVSNSVPMHAQNKTDEDPFAETLAPLEQSSPEEGWVDNSYAEADNSAPADKPAGKE